MASSLGVASGIDLESLVQSLMISERQPLDRLQTKQKAIQDQISAFGKIQSAMSTLSTAMKNLSPTTLNGTKATSSKEDFLVAKTTGNASLGSMSVEVQQLASFTKIGFDLGTRSTTVGGITTVTESYEDAIKGAADGGTGFAAGKLSFSFPTGGPSNFEVNVADGASLADIRDSINNSDGTVSATIVNGTSGAQLILTSKESGERFDFDVTATNTDPTFDTELGVNKRSLKVFEFTSSRTPNSVTGNVDYTDTDLNTRSNRVSGGQDARLTVDGVSVRSSSNSVTSAISGLTLELKQVTTAPVTVTISQDTTEAEKTMNEFIKSYNALIDVVNDVAKNTPQEQGADPNERTGGPLRSNSTVRSVVAQLQNTILSPLEGASEPYNSFLSLGVKLEPGGKLSLDSGAFKKALADAPQAVENLFTRQVGGVGDVGLGQRVENLIKTMTDKTEGIIGIELESLNSQTKRMQLEQDNLNRRLEMIEANYRRQFSGLDMLVGSLKSQGDYLMQQLSRM